ncbi:MAG: hypothetical protein K6G88_03285 [Lachnospiraceae bacterium]|nr:hypothetical protein [Lachnospiraceae bacterium]
MKLKRIIAVVFNKEAVIISQNKVNGVVEIAVHTYEGDELHHTIAYLNTMLLEGNVDCLMLFNGKLPDYYEVENGEIVKGRVVESTVETLIKIFRDYDLDDIKLLDALSSTYLIKDGASQISYNKEVSRLPLCDRELVDPIAHVVFYYDGLSDEFLNESR